MSNAWFDIFALTIHFIIDDRVPYHITFGLFEAHNTSKTTLMEQVNYFWLNINSSTILYLTSRTRTQIWTPLLLFWTWLCHVHYYSLFHLSMGLVLAMWCPRQGNMPQMMIKLGLWRKKLIWLNFFLPYKKPLHGQIFLATIRKNGN
jgi:hypothetical protein